MSNESHSPDRVTARQRKVWDKAAPTYDRQMSFFERVWLGGRDWLGEQARGRVLEVAVGTGRNLPYYPSGVTVTGIELSPAMLALARSRAAGARPDTVLIEGDAHHLPFDDGSFDTVVCWLGLCTIPDPGRAIAEMERVLVPGGQLLLHDHVASTWPPLRAAQWLAEQVTGRGAGEYFTRRQLPAVESAGLEIAETWRSKAGTVERLRAVKPG